MFRSACAFVAATRSPCSMGRSRHSTGAPSRSKSVVTRTPRVWSASIALIERYHPDVVVIEECGAKGSRRSPRIRRLYHAIAAHALAQDIEVRRFSRPLIRAGFAPLGAVTKHEIARTIAKNIPAFDHRLPPLRKPWMSEDHCMGLFDATSLVFADYLTRTDHQRTA